MVKNSLFLKNMVYSPNMKKIETFTTPETEFLSNFYPYKQFQEDEMCPHDVDVSYMGLQFKCVENAYMAAKCDSVDDMVKFIDKTPHWAKDYSVQGLISVRKDWDSIKIAVMTDLVWQKFANNPELKKMLLDTGDMELIEGNTWGDVFWGVCEGKGQNHLGKILMMTRDKLRKIEPVSGILQP